MKGHQATVVEYPFDPYFDQQVQELERAALPSGEEARRPVEAEKKDVLARADTGGPPPPVPGLLPGKSFDTMPWLLSRRLTMEQRSIQLRNRRRPRMRNRRLTLQGLLGQLALCRSIS